MKTNKCEVESLVKVLRRAIPDNVSVESEHTSSTTNGSTGDVVSESYSVKISYGLHNMIVFVSENVVRVKTDHGTTPELLSIGPMEKALMYVGDCGLEDIELYEGCKDFARGEPGCLDGVVECVANAVCKWGC